MVASTSHGRGGPGRRQPVAGGRHRERHQTQADALQRPAGEQPPERHRQRGEQASGDHHGDRADQQGDGQRPLGRGERHVRGPGDRGHQRCPEAAHDRDDQTDEDQHGYERARHPPALVRGHRRSLATLAR
jgi:hypothetical protein